MKKRIPSELKKKIIILLLANLILLFLFVVVTEQNKLNLRSDLRGRLNSLRWEDKGISVVLEKRGDNVILALQSVQASELGPTEVLNVISNIKTAVDNLINYLKSQGAPVKEDSFSMNFFGDTGLLELNFEGNIADTILNGSVLFLEQAAKYCDFDLASNIKEKIEDDNIHSVNLTENECGIEDVSGILSIIDFSIMYAQNDETENEEDLKINCSEENNSTNPNYPNSLESNLNVDIEEDSNLNPNLENNNSKIKSKIALSPNKKLIFLKKGESENFNIQNEGDYLIEWYLDNEKIQDSSDSYTFEALNSGRYVLKVKIQNESVFGSNLWNIIVKEEVEVPEKEEEINFYLILVPILTIFLIILVYFFLKKNGQKNNFVKK